VEKFLPGVDWERNRFHVHSPKTEHQEDVGARWVPIFPELRPYLDTAWDMAAEGAVHVITRNRGTNANLRTQLGRIIREAGLTPWPRLFQNLRASRATELINTYPLHVVCKWIGNSPRVAADHYLQVTEEHLESAAKSGAESGAPALQDAVQRPAASNGTEQGRSQQASADTGLSHTDAAACESAQEEGMTPTGFEPVSRP
jgi:hypothetical protein